MWFGHGCSGRRLLLEHDRSYGSGHGCSGYRNHQKVERTYGLGMDALVVACFLEHGRNYGSWHGCSAKRSHSKMNGIMTWAWMLWSEYALGTRTDLWFGHGCSG